MLRWVINVQSSDVIPTIHYTKFTMIGGQILKPEDMSRPLFLDSDGNPAPINIHELAEVYVLS